MFRLGWGGSWPEQGGADTHHGRPGVDGGFQIIGHAHGKRVDFGRDVAESSEVLGQPRMRALAAEVDDMRLAWSGPTAAGSDASYVIQGPTLIIEYAGQDLGGDPLDHLHTMYRDPTNEYGGQLRPNER